jgi:hypothetical protein
VRGTALRVTCSPRDRVWSHEHATTPGARRGRNCGGPVVSADRATNSIDCNGFSAGLLRTSMRVRSRQLLWDSFRPRHRLRFRGAVARRLAGSENSFSLVARVERNPLNQMPWSYGSLPYGLAMSASRSAILSHSSDRRWSGGTEGQRAGLARVGKSGSQGASGSGRVRLHTPRSDLEPLTSAMTTPAL